MTKVNVVYTLSDVYDQLSELSEEQNFSEEGSILLRTLVNSKKIAIYPTPERMGKYVEKIEHSLSKLPRLVVS